MYNYEHAKVTRVIDGDTVELTIDVGFHCRVQENFRLYGINAMELSTVAGQRARDHLIQLLGYDEGVEPEVIVTTYKPEKYGRWLTDLWLVGYDRGDTINKQMVTDGYAVEYYGGPRV